MGYTVVKDDEQTMIKNVLERNRCENGVQKIKFSKNGLQKFIFIIAVTDIHNL